MAKYAPHVLIGPDLEPNFYVLVFKNDYAIVLYNRNDTYEPQAFKYWLMLEHNREIDTDKDINTFEVMQKAVCKGVLGDIIAPVFKYYTKSGDPKKRSGLDHRTFKKHHMPLKEEYLPYKFNNEPMFEIYDKTFDIIEKCDVDKSLDLNVELDKLKSENKEIFDEYNL